MTGNDARTSARRGTATSPRWGTAMRARRGSTTRARRGTALAVLAAVAALAALAALLAGCVVGPNYRRPPAAAPAAWREPPPPDWKSATPRDELARGKWWEVFGDPQLNALEEQVSVSNQSIAQAEAQFRAARAAAAVARAGLFPAVTAGASATKSHRGAATSVTSPTSTSTTLATGTTTLYQTPIDVSYEVDVWGRVRRQIEANVATAQASAGDLETLRLSMQPSWRWTTSSCTAWMPSSSC